MDGQVALSALPPGGILEELFLPGIPGIMETVNLHFKFEVVVIHCCSLQQRTSTHHDITDFIALSVNP